MGLRDYLLGWGELLALPLFLVAVVVIGIWRFERTVIRHGRRGGGGMANAMGGLIDVFDPAQARAARELQDQRNVGPVSRNPERDPDDPLQITFGADGEPLAFRIRRPR